MDNWWFARFQSVCWFIVPKLLFHFREQNWSLLWALKLFWIFLLPWWLLAIREHPAIWAVKTLHFSFLDQNYFSCFRIWIKFRYLFWIFCQNQGWSVQWHVLLDLWCECRCKHFRCKGRLDQLWFFMVKPQSLLKSPVLSIPCWGFLDFLGSWLGILPCTTFIDWGRKLPARFGNSLKRSFQSLESIRTWVLLCQFQLDLSNSKPNHNWFPWGSKISKLLFFSVHTKLFQSQQFPLDWHRFEFQEQSSCWSVQFCIWLHS